MNDVPPHVSPLTVPQRDIWSDPIQPTTFVDLLQQRARHQPEKVAYTFLRDGETEHARVTYAQLDRHARAIAATLQRMVAAGERALLLYPSGLEYIAPF